MKQQTLKTGFSVEGKGLHTGQSIHAAVLPAGEDTGIRLCRTDLPGRPTYEALADYVGGTSRGTVLTNGKWKISTVEHLLAALYATGVTNCLIEVDAPEIPIMDGSSLPFVREIERAGVMPQEAEAKEFVVTEPIRFDNGKGSTMLLEPSDKYEVEVHVDYPSPVLNKQSAVLTDLSDFAAEIAPARTFCFLREIEWLLHLGLIKGGDMQNALVIYDKKVSQWSLNRMADKMGQPRLDADKLGYLSPLKYENEPARHKLLDLIGDLGLAGCHLRGKITATCPGHGFNTWCCRQLKTIIA